MRPKALLMAIFLAAATIAAATPASADWSGEAVIDTDMVHVNFSEELRVTVLNGQSVPLEIVSVSLTINWEGMPTLYRVFEGSAILQPGESRTFVSPGTRMPNVEPGTYSCFTSVTARGADGLAVEHRYADTIRADVFDLSFMGIPEEVLVPGALTLGMLLVTASLFRFERTPGWPPFSALPRWGYHFRRT